MNTGEPPTPAYLRELAGRAEVLAADMVVAREALSGADDEPTRRVGYRLDDAAGEVRRAAGDLAVTAEDLARIRGRSVCSRGQDTEPSRA